MSSRANRLGLLALAIFALLMYWGCSQPEDVITPVSSSRLTLTPERLPTNPPGTVYQLWAANGTDTIPMAKFAWNFDSNAFFETNGTTRRADSNSFILPDDIFSYRTVIISVEPVPDNNANKPNAIMLLDTVITLEPETTRLKFPRSDSLYNGFMFFNMSTPSDSDLTTNDGYGVWLSGYEEKVDSIRDTVGIVSYSIDSSSECTPSVSNPVCDSIVVRDLINIRTVTDERVIGFDTFTVQYVRFDSVVEYQTTPPFTVDEITIDYDIEPNSNVNTEFIRENFVQPSLYLPNLSPFGWVYRTWVMSPILDGGCGNATFSEPAWVNETAINQYFPQNGSMMLTAGAFTAYDQKDIGANPNPYSLSSRVPNFPGEDFLTGLPCGGGLPAGGFVPAGGGPAGANGCVFIAIEPKNFSLPTATNFPLVVLVGNVPTNQGTVTNNSVFITMRNWTSATHNDLQGFPLVIVNVERL